MQPSPLYQLNLQDAIKGLIVSIGSAVIATISESLNTGSLNFNWRQIGLTALAAGMAYLAKNFFTPPKNIGNDAVK